MAATVGEITAYIYSIRCAFVEYGEQVSRYQKIGSEDIECYKVRFNLLNHYVRLIIDYLDSSDYENINFFTTVEARDIMQKINDICNTYYMLDL